MDNSPHNASAQNAAIEPPDLPDCWRSPELAVREDPHLTASKRLPSLRVTLVVLAVVLALALVIGAQFDLAAVHYAGGVYALKVHSYSWAADEFSAARVLVFPYRDARSLEEQARRDAKAD